MTREQAMVVLSHRSGPTLGVFRGAAAAQLGISRQQLTRLGQARLIERVHPDTYRLTAVPRSNEQALIAALLWAGPGAADAGCSAGAHYAFDGVRVEIPELVVPRDVRRRSANMRIHRTDDRAALMVRRFRGLPVTGVEATLVCIASTVSADQLEIAAEDARRRRLTSIPALRAYLDRFGGSGRAGTGKLRALLAELDPEHPSRSTLEVLTRRLLVANGLDGFVREFPIVERGRTYRYDFAFPASRVILETNGRRWHDDPLDYEADHEKWSVPARHGFRIVFATWADVVRRPERFVRVLGTTMGAPVTSRA